MNHAKKSLETFLGKSGNGSTGHKMLCRHVIKSLLPEIDAYRERGYSLSEIHSALVRGGDLACTMTTFKTYYYRERTQKESSQSSSKKLPSQPLAVEDVEILPEPLSAEKLTPNSSVVRSASDALLSMSDAAIKSQQDLARRMFDQRRAELGIRRREK